MLAEDSVNGAAFVLIGTPGSAIPHSERVVEASISMEFSVRGTIARRPGGDAGPIGAIFDATATLGGCSAQVIFRNDPHGYHPHLLCSSREVGLIEPRLEIPLRRCRALSDARGDPMVVLRWLESGFAPLGPPIVLGRLSQAPFAVSATMLLPIHVALSVSALDCVHGSGPILAVAGEWKWEQGLVAALGFRDGLCAEPQPTEDAAFLMLSPDGECPIREQTARGGIGGTPMISLRLYDGHRAPASPEYVLGRCVSLAPD